MFRLGADGGAVQNGNADAAIQKALETIADGRAGGFHIDGIYKYTREHKMDFIGKRRHMLITGDGAASQLIPDFLSDNGRGIWLSNLEQLIVRNITFAGQPIEVLESLGRKYDCGNAFMATMTQEVVFDRVNIYGLTTTKFNGFGLFFFDWSGFTQLGGQIRSCAAPGQSVFSFKRYNRVHISGVNVLDFGQLDGWDVGKTTWASSHKDAPPFTYAWYTFTDPIASGVSGYLGIPTFEHMKLDEAALYGIAVDGSGDSGTGWARGVKLNDVGINVRVAGVKATRAEYVVAEDCYFTYRPEQPVWTLDCVNVKSTRLTRCIADKEARDLRITGSQSQSLAMDECKGFRKVLVPVGLKWTKDGVPVQL